MGNTYTNELLEEILAELKYSNKIAKAFNPSEVSKPDAYDD